MLVAYVATGPVGDAVTAGCEEEGVPVTVTLRVGDALPLARAAARNAPGGVGIGADQTRVCVCLAAAAGRAYLEASLNETRRLSQDAARLVARRPLR
jgi:hypothetical protein